MPTIEIDGKTLEVAPGTMLIQAADAAGIYIPRFCYHEKLSIAANCRMCMVEVANIPKPVPACATPVSDGMKVFTESVKAVEAQKGTLEFLLINHPLDCPVCDQGGECPLQDQAMGYGKDVSRFTERKRVIEDKDIGPLVATEMTRCIHCTRCVRFGREVAGIMELGAPGRGEHMEIGTFLGRSLDSEVSGNVVDLCPVGALTNKPYRFSARSWELRSADSVSPHDCVGTNLTIQSLRQSVKRVLPRTNEAINECWLSDRDRYSYQAFDSADRLVDPMIRVDGHWQKTDWETALRFTVDGVKRVVGRHGPDQLGALASPLSTLEEFYLLQKLTRALGSHNVDHRLRNLNSEDDKLAPLYPSAGLPITELERREALLLIGSNIRKEQPLLGLRVRKAAMRGARVMAINALDYAFNFPVSQQCVVAPSDMPMVLARIARAVYGDSALPDGVSRWAIGEISEAERAIAESLRRTGDRAHMLLGTTALGHPRFDVLRALTQAIAEQTGASFGLLPEANGVAGWLAGCLPHREPVGVPVDTPGRSAQEMCRDRLKAYLLMGIEPALDCVDGQEALNALSDAEFVVALSSFDIGSTTPADVLLPMTPFSENSGTLVNCEGLAQGFAAAVAPRGEARPAWKILRVLGNLFGVPGFDYLSSAEVRAEMSWQPMATSPALSQWRIEAVPQAPSVNGMDLERVVDVPLYRVDPYVRRAPALQMTADNPPPAARLSPEQAARLGLDDGDRVYARAGDATIQIDIRSDARVPAGCVYIPAGFSETAALGGHGAIRIVKV